MLGAIPMKRLWRVVRLALSNPRLFVGKIRNEFLAPSSRVTATARRLYCFFVPDRGSRLGANAQRLLFVYDTLNSPVTFDFLHYLYQADWLRARMGKARIDIVLVTRGDLTTSREQAYISAVDRDNINWRLTNLVLPLTRLFASVGRVHFVDHSEAFTIVRDYQHVHPEGYGYANPKTAICRLDSVDFVYSPSLTVSETASAVVDAYFSGLQQRRLVTITLRSYGYMPTRNSNIGAWVRFAQQLDPFEYRVVFVPDASSQGVSTFQELSGMDVFDAACWNVEIRAALYRRAWMNMGVVSGPLTISCLLDNVLTLAIDRSLDYPDDYAEHIRSSTGLIPGTKPAFYSDSCHFFSGRDDDETILRAFNAFAK